MLITAYMRIFPAWLIDYNNNTATCYFFSDTVTLVVQFLNFPFLKTTSFTRINLSLIPALNREKTQVTHMLWAVLRWKPAATSRTFQLKPYWGCWCLRAVYRTRTYQNFIPSLNLGHSTKNVHSPLVAVLSWNWNASFTETFSSEGVLGTRNRPDPDSNSTTCGYVNFFKKFFLYLPALPHIKYSFHLPIEYQTNNRPLSAPL